MTIKSDCLIGVFPYAILENQNHAEEQLCVVVSPYIILPVLAFLINFFTISYAMALNIRNRVNRSYVMFSTVTCLWVLCSAAFHLPLPDHTIVPFSKFSSLLWYFTGFFFTHFTYVFLRRRRDLFYFASLGVTILSFITAVSTDLIVSGFIRYPWGWRFSEGVLFTPASLLTIVMPVIVCWALALRHRLSTGDPVRRRQLAPLLAGTMIALVFAAVNQFLFPRLPGFQNIVRYTASWSVLLSIFVFYTIIRYRFLTPGINDITGELFASAKEGVIILNSIGSVLHINNAAVSILGTGTSAPSSLRHGRADKRLPDRRRVHQSPDNDRGHGRETDIAGQSVRDMRRFNDHRPDPHYQ